MLTVDDFRGFFEAVHGHAPFPWQMRLLREVAQDARWPEVLDLPTGAGKTAAIDIALFHLALEAQDPSTRRAPVRIAFVVDRRLIVDDAFERAQRLAKALARGSGGICGRVAEALQTLAGVDAPPLIARALRGGIPREDDWARTPAQPTILCSTVDQVGSRLLFRGYGIRDTMKPLHAGLVGADCLILLDEAHLAEPFRQTLRWVARYRGPKWRQVEESSPWGVALLTATPGSSDEGVTPFRLAEDDLGHAVLARRIRASKRARLLLSSGSNSSEPSIGEERAEEIEAANRVSTIVAEVGRALQHFTTGAGSVKHPAIGVVVNRVTRARQVFERVREGFENCDAALIIGPTRAVQREELTRTLSPIRTGAARDLERPLILVATQCLEAGVDIDLDGLITELAALDALRQRFGRLNRDGRPIVPYGAILAWKSEISARHEDPVYGRALAATWEDLNQHAVAEGRTSVVELGIGAFSVAVRQEALAPKDDAPILLPAHLDLLAQTSPVPLADPDVGAFLHGPKREPDSITLVWRGDIEASAPAGGVRRLLTLAPPRSGEAIELPIWTVRRWLQSGAKGDFGDLADVATETPEDPDVPVHSRRPVFRWKGGDDERSDWVEAGQIRPGDTIVIPGSFGGVDEHGWNPSSRRRAADVGAEATRVDTRRRVTVRIAPALLVPPTTIEEDWERVAEDWSRRIADALEGAEPDEWKSIRNELLALDLPETIRGELNRLDGKAGRVDRPMVYRDVYPLRSDGRPGGVVIVGSLLADAEGLVGFEGTTEDDLAGSLTGPPVSLVAHCSGVAGKAEEFARRAGLPEGRTVDVRVAGSLHDAGKVDERFQAWLYHSDPLGADPTDPETILAKSARPLPSTARKWAALPDRWRHEALSVRLAAEADSFSEAADPELVLWLIGTHHGHGRSLFPHDDPADGSVRRLPEMLGLAEALAAGAGPQSLSYEWNGLDWPTLQGRVQARYGLWELARMEAVLRLADHRVSEAEQSERSVR